MKVWSDDGKLTVQAESVEDMVTLMAISGKGSVVKKAKKELIDVDVTQGKQSKGKRKKHVWRRECDICGKQCKGLRGLGLHMRKKHNIKGREAAKKEDLLREFGATPAVSVVENVSGNIKRGEFNL